MLRAPWRKLVCAPIDISQNVRATAEMFESITRAGTPLAAYLDRFGRRDRPMWDEVAAATWIDPSLVTHAEHHHLDVETTPNAAWGETLSRPAGSSDAPGIAAEIQLALDVPRFRDLFVDLCSRP